MTYPMGLWLRNDEKPLRLSLRSARAEEFKDESAANTGGIGKEEDDEIRRL